MRGSSLSSLVVAVLAIVAIAFPPAADAAAQRTFVASTGSPANTAFNCSIARPCRAFSEAIGVTNPKGEVVVLDSAGYGPVTITKSVSIIAPPGIYGGISVFAGDGITVNAGVNDIVVLRGLSVNGQGGNRGIFFQAGARLRVEKCVVSGMAVWGISHNAAGGEMIVLDTIVRDNVSSGIVVVGDVPSVVLDHVRVEHNGGNGLVIAPTVGSLGVRATVVDSIFAHNEGKGIGAGAEAGTTVTIVVERSVLSYNGQDGIAVQSGPGSAVATFTRNTINDNGGNGIWTQGSVSGTAFENVVHRNSGIGIFVDVGVGLWMSANSASRNLASDYTCTAGSGVSSLGNNTSFSSASSGGCHGVASSAW